MTSLVKDIIVDKYNYFTSEEFDQLKKFVMENQNFIHEQKLKQISARLRRGPRR